MSALTVTFANHSNVGASAVYGGNAPNYLNGAKSPAAPAHDVYGRLGGDLLSGLNIGAAGSATEVGGKIVGALPSHEWLKLPFTSFFANLQPGRPFYNQWAATPSTLSRAYNFAYSDRFSPVLVSLNPAEVDTLHIVPEDAAAETG